VDVKASMDEIKAAKERILDCPTGRRALMLGVRTQVILSKTSNVNHNKRMESMIWWILCLCKKSRRTSVPISSRLTRYSHLHTYLPLCLEQHESQAVPPPPNSLPLALVKKYMKVVDLGFAVQWKGGKVSALDHIRRLGRLAFTRLVLRAVIP